jgi:hypothetical protein
MFIVPFVVDDLGCGDVKRPDFVKTSHAGH